MAKYLTPEWLAAVEQEVAAASATMATEFKGVDTSLKNVVKGTPEGVTKVILYRFKDGKLTEARLGTDADVGAEKAEFTMTGDYAVMAALNRGELDSKTAIMRKQLRLEGNILKALRLNKAFDVFAGVVRKVPTEY